MSRRNAMSFALSAAQAVLSVVALGVANGAAQQRPTAAAEPVLLQAPSLGVVGTLRDRVTGEPIRAATVELLGADRRTVLNRTISNLNGAFRLVSTEPGTVHVRAWRLAMDTLFSGPIELIEGQPVTVTLEALGQPVQLAPLDVAVEARVRLLLDRGFYERQRVGAGVFLTPEEVATRATSSTIDLMRTVPGIVFLDNEAFPINQPGPCPNGWSRTPESMCERSGARGMRAPSMLTRSGLNTVSGIPCLPAIYLDGFQVQSSGDVTGDREFDLRTLLASHILAIEAFRGAAEVPAQYSGASSACGVIMIWTKDGLPVRPPGAGS